MLNEFMGDLVRLAGATHTKMHKGDIKIQKIPAFKKLSKLSKFNLTCSSIDET